MTMTERVLVRQWQKENRGKDTVGSDHLQVQFGAAFLQHVCVSCVNSEQMRGNFGINQLRFWVFKGF